MLFSKKAQAPGITASAALRLGFFICLACLLGAGLLLYSPAGRPVAALDGVTVYGNGFPLSSHGRNLTPDGYNIGLKYQCVEFVKRYYLQHYNHRMPDTYGHAFSFFDAAVPDGGLNRQRGLLQYKNSGKTLPQKGDILVFGRAWYNPYGHVAVVAKTEADKVEYIQQNSFSAHASLPVVRRADGARAVRHKRLLGWLRMPAGGKDD